MSALARQLAAARDLHRTAGRRDTGVRDVLALVGTVVDLECVSLHRWDPLARRHATVAAFGYSHAVLTAIDRGQHLDPSFPAVRARPRPLRLGEIPAAGRTAALYREVLAPSGFGGGVTQGLFARDGRYLGLLNASTTTARDPDDDTVTLLELVAADVGGTLDPIPAAAPATRALESGESDGVLVTAGLVRPLTPGAREQLASPRSPLRPAIDGVLRGRSPGRSVLLLHRCDLLAVRIEGGPHGVVLLHHPATAPCGLTLRELEVLDGVSRGYTNIELARRLHVRPRTIATHVEHLLVKTGTPNRAAAARVAAGIGLVVWNGAG